MDFTPEQIGLSFGIAYLFAETLKYLSATIYKVITGKKSVQESVDKIGTNHITHLQNSVDTGFKEMNELNHADHQKQIELLTRCATYLEILSKK